MQMVPSQPSAPCEFRQNDETDRPAFDAIRCAEIESEPRPLGKWLQKSASLRGLRGFFFDVDLHLGGDVAKHFDRYGIFAEGFERIGELHLTLVDFETLGGQA